MQAGLQYMPCNRPHSRDFEVAVLWLKASRQCANMPKAWCAAIPRCPAGYGASATSPNSCQVCPKGTFSDALADSVPQPPLTSLVRIPPGIGNGKGKGGCYTCNPTWKECTPCCEASVRNCTLTTLTPGATSWDACKPVESFFTASPSPPPAPAAAEVQAEAQPKTEAETQAAAASAAGHAFDLPVNTTTASTQAHTAAAGEG